MRPELWISACACLVVVGCGSRAAAPRDAAVTVARQDTLALHMRERYADLRIMERHLVDGDLDTVRDYARGLARARTPDALAAWTAELATMRRAAEALGVAATTEAAATSTAALAIACGGCHVATGADLELAPPPLPSDQPDPLARMAHHQWAADRIWYAMIAPSDPAWRDGMEVLARTPLPVAQLAVVAPPSARGEVGALGDRLQRLARDAMPATAFDDRRRRYGEILAVCAACHAAAQ